MKKPNHQFHFMGNETHIFFQNFLNLTAVSAYIGYSISLISKIEKRLFAEAVTGQTNLNDRHSGSGIDGY